MRPSTFPVIFLQCLLLVSCGGEAVGGRVPESKAVSANIEELCKVVSAKGDIDTALLFALTGIDTVVYRQEGTFYTGDTIMQGRNVTLAIIEESSGTCLRAILLTFDRSNRYRSAMVIKTACDMDMSLKSFRETDVEFVALDSLYIIEREYKGNLEDIEDIKPIEERVLWVINEYGILERR